MKKIFFMISILFAVLTFAGMVYVLKNHGNVNAGYAVIPMALTIACFSVYKLYANKENK